MLISILRKWLTYVDVALVVGLVDDKLTLRLKWHGHVVFEYEIDLIKEGVKRG